MGDVIGDVRYALRQMMKAPGFTVTAVLTLALGIGANAAIFTLVHGVLLRHLPVKEPGQLIRVGDNDDCCVNGGMPEHNDYAIFSYDLYVHLRDNTPEFEQLAAMQAGGGTGTVTARREGGTAPALAAYGEYVSGNYFQMFGLNPAAGRLMLPADDAPNAPFVAVMGYQTWQQNFAGDPGVVGSTFVLNAHPFVVIGVAPEGFYGDRLNSPVDYYIPMSAEPTMAVGSLLHRQNINWVYLLGRIKKGTALAPVQAKMSLALRQWLAANVKQYATEDGKLQLQTTHTVLTPGAVGIGNLQMQYAAGLHLLIAIAALVLLIACANIANLVLVRGLARRAETSIRMALGASRARLIRQILTESVVLACLGGLAGICVAYGGGADAAVAGVLGFGPYADRCGSFAGGAGVCVSGVAADGSSVRAGSGVDDEPCGAGGGVAGFWAVDGGRVFAGAEGAGCGAGGTFACAACAGGAGDAEFERAGAPELWVGDGAPADGVPGAGERGVPCGAVAGTVYGAGGTVQGAAGGGAGGAVAVYADAGEQLGGGG